MINVEIFLLLPWILAILVVLCAVNKSLLVACSDDFLKQLQQEEYDCLAFYASTILIILKLVRIPVLRKSWNIKGENSLPTLRWISSVQYLIKH